VKFNLVDRIEHLSDERIVAVKYVSLAEEYIADHFPTVSRAAGRHDARGADTGGGVASCTDGPISPARWRPKGSPPT
jgi:hypothetical protein